jgi:multidrug resistance efflux pump
MERYHVIGGHLRLDPEGTVTSYADAQRALDDAQATVEALQQERDRLRAALEQLARLGNEPYYGNSDGNRIAQKALGLDPYVYMTTPAAGGTRR